VDDPLVELQGLTKRFGDFEAVSGISLEVRRGEAFALLGPNGAGKTTTIRMLMGILQPTAGRAFVDGLDCFSQRHEVMRRVGYLPDEPVFYDFLRGSEIVRFVGEMHGLARDQIERRFRELSERLSLEEAEEEFAVNYSKGMRKKLALICALLPSPPLLILDEPTNGLDPFATRAMHTLIHELVSDGVSVFFSTHLLDQAQRLADRVGILAEGRLAAVGTLEELRDSFCPGGSLEEIFFSVVPEKGEQEKPGAAQPPEAGK